MSTFLRLTVAVLVATVCATSSARAQSPAVLSGAPAGSQILQDRAATLSPLIEVIQLNSVRLSLGKYGHVSGLAGEVRNISQQTIAFVELEYTLYDSSLQVMSTVHAAVNGARTMRLPSQNTNIAVLFPGDVGVFQQMYGVNPPPFAAVQLTNSVASIVDVVPPLANVNIQPGTLDSSGPYRGILTNLGPAVVSRAAVSAAGYNSGNIVYVTSATVQAPPVAIPCGTGTQAILQPGQQAEYVLGFPSGTYQPLAYVDHVMAFWQEIGTLDPSSESLPNTGGTGSTAISVQTAGWCAATTSPWITITSGATGTESTGTLTFSVQPNPGPQRSGTINVSGMIFTITQAGGYPCAYSISHNPIVLGAREMSQDVAVTTESFCPWTATSDTAWLSIAASGGTGNGTFTVHADPNIDAAPRAGAVAAGGAIIPVRQFGTGRPFDLNGDQHMDLVWRHQVNGLVAAWMMNGTAMLEGGLLTPGEVPDLDWTIAGGGDLDADGQPDLVWQHTGDGWISTWLMNGTTQTRGLFLTPEYVADTGWRVRTLADLDLDTHPDLVWQHDDGRVAVWFMNGLTATSGDPLEPAAVADTGWRIAGSGDFDADGSSDLVWQHADGRVAVWIMSGPTLRDGHLLSPATADPGWQLRAVGDLNGDGSPDLVWQHGDDGRITAWLMMGSTRLEEVSLGQVADTAWHIVGPR